MRVSQIRHLGIVLVMGLVRAHHHVEPDAATDITDERARSVNPGRNRGVLPG